MRAIQVALVLLLLALPILAAADQTSDDALYDKVRIVLANDREVGGGKIDVKVAGGVVELTGKVRSDKVKTRAEKLTKKVKGVQKVVNNLVVAPV